MSTTSVNYPRPSNVLALALGYTRRVDSTASLCNCRSTWGNRRMNTLQQYSPAQSKAWLPEKVCLIPKKDGDSSLLQDHRPLTVTSVLYRLFAQVIKAWMGAWAETSGHLTKLQNGFRQNRRVERLPFCTCSVHRNCTERIIGPSDVLSGYY